MQKLITTLLTGAALAGVVPAAASAFPNREIRDAHRAAEAQERREAAREHREDARERRQEAREEWRDRRDDWRDDHRDRRYDRDWRDRHDRWGDDRDDWRRYGYSYGRAPWNGAWTPYGFGYNDSFARDWVLRNFADRNHNGRISEKEWRRAQQAFYRLADRNRDGRISSGEYYTAMNIIRSGHPYRW